MKNGAAQANATPKLKGMASHQPLIFWRGPSTQIHRVTALAPTSRSALKEREAAVLLALLALPLILSGLGWIGWKLLQSRLISCTACGTTGLKGAAVCAVCGTPYASAGCSPVSAAVPSAPASDLTIDVVAQDVNSDS